MKKKKSRRIAKILASLAIVISLGSVIAWHLMMDAQAHDYSKEDVGGSKHFESGEALIRINGPSGTSELWVKIISNDYNKVWYTKGSGKKKKTYYYKNQPGSDFIATQGHTYTVKWGKGGRGPYDLHVKEQTITPTKNNSGNYTGISFEVVFGIPAHQQHTAQNYAVADSPNDAKTGQMLQCWSGNDNGFWQHSKHVDYDRMYGSNDDNDNNEEKITINMSLANTGLCTNYGTRYVGSSLTFNLEYPSGTMTFDGNGGQLKQNNSEGWQNSVSRTLKDRDPYGAFPQGSRSGYELDSFNSKADGTGMEIEEDWQFCGTWTVYAIWKPKTYSISYDAGDGDGDMSETSATYNKTVTLSQNKFTRKGYKFLGWSLKNDGSSVDYQNGASFTYDKADDITLYAVWEKDNYEVKFHGNGSSATDYTRNLPYNKTTNLPENVFERPGYTFMGWAPEEELDRYKVIPKYTNGAEVKDLCEPGETCNLYAIWRKTDGSFETKNIIHDDKMFFGDVNITGGNGTEYDQGMYDSKAAKIDKENDPGYFTDRYKKED